MLIKKVPPVAWPLGLRALSAAKLANFLSPRKF